MKKLGAWMLVTAFILAGCASADNPGGLSEREAGLIGGGGLGAGSGSAGSASARGDASVAGSGGSGGPRRDQDRRVSPADADMADRGGILIQDDGRYYDSVTGDIYPDQSTALKAFKGRLDKNQDQQRGAEADANRPAERYFCVPAQQSKFWDNTAMMTGSMANAIAMIGMGVLAPMYQFQIAREDQKIARSYLQTQETLAAQNAELGWPTYMGYG